jgi:hypothetical protein
MSQLANVPLLIAVNVAAGYNCMLIVAAVNVTASKCAAAAHM